ncbi:unnamed protein product, partial [Discosporangium mesarthrocarpum]
PWVRHWIHTGHLHIRGLKMSKSLKNFVAVRDFLASVLEAAQDYRVFCLLHKYSARCMCPVTLPLQL